MALQKQSVNLNFSKGLDLKDDPWQIEIGKFLTLVNSVFDVYGRLTKRNGFPSFSHSPSIPASLLSTFKDDLIATTGSLEAYERTTGTWLGKGVYFPRSVSVTPIIRNNVNQLGSDTAISSSGLACVAYSETSDYLSFSYKYSVANATTGLSIISPTALAGTSGSVTGAPRVFLLGNYFVIVFVVTIAAVEHLQYITVNTTTLAVTSAVDITNSFTSNIFSVAWDGVVAGSKLYLAWNGASASGIKMVTLDSSLVLSAVTNPDASHTAFVVGLWADTSGGTPVIWVGYQDSGDGYTLAVGPTLSVLLAATSFTVNTGFTNITGTATGAIAKIYCEYPTAPSFDATIAERIIRGVSVTQAGSVSGEAIILRQSGLASKAVIYGGASNFLIARQSAFQSCYFLINSLDLVGFTEYSMARFAYQNGGGYISNANGIPTGLPQMVLSGSTFYASYRFKDLIEAANKQTNISALSTATNPIQLGGIYSQTGINLSTISLSSTPFAEEVSNSLNLTGGFLWSFDGTLPSENNFFVWPELPLNADGTYKGISTAATSLTHSCSTVSGSNVITSTTSTADVFVGMLAAGTGVTAGSIVIAVNAAAKTVTLNLPCTSSGSGRTITFTGNIGAGTYFYQFTYEWTDNQGNTFRSAPSVPVTIPTTGTTSVNTIYVPTLPLTYKTTNPVKLVGYRWSLLQQNYFQFTSITVPVLNSTSVSYIAITDASNDTSIIGNNLLYTTGGVLENISPPPTDVISLFDNRMWLLSAEDPNLYFYSKEVQENVPLEMSPELTYYVTPVIGDQGNAGPIKASFPMDDKLFHFHANAIQYTNGTGPDSTGANNQYSKPILVNSPVGCSNPRSIVLIPDGIMFQSNKGIWILTHDLQAIYIGAPVESFNSYTVTSAVQVPGTTQVRFGLSSGQMLSYDYFVKQWGYFSLDSVSSTVYRNLHTSVNTAGTVSQESVGSFIDGASTAVLMSFSTGWISAAGIMGYQRACWLFMLAKYVSAHTLTIGIAYDFDPTIVQTITITPDSTLPEEWQFGFQRQTCQAFQLTFTEGQVGSTTGAGFYLSSLNMVVGLKKTYPRNIPVSRKTG